jgi:soluble lytic murein transglycosylase-like protein
MRKLILAASVMALLCTGAGATDVVTNFRPAGAESTKKEIAPVSRVKPPKGRARYSQREVEQMVVVEARAQGVPTNFAVAIANHESRFKCSAVGLANERGVMQIKPSTARGIGYKGPTNGLNDCRTGIYWGMKYLKMAINAANGDLKRAAFLYNAGINAKSKNPAKKRYVLAVFSVKKATSID